VLKMHSMQLVQRLKRVSSLEALELPGEQKFGVQIIKRALEEPLRQIASNAGLEGSIVVNNVKNSEGSFGLNAATDEYVDLLEAGILDPTKVTRSALQNAASIAGLMLTTEACIADVAGDDAAGGGMPGGMGGMGGMPGMM